MVALALSLFSTLLKAGDLPAQFARPPASARPWVYWFWNNGNVTKAGITADLEAMKRAGIGGVIIMDVVERFAPPPGTADFMNAEWQELFHFAVTEAHRLGLEINMTNGPGWCGSSGPWMTPELSMQRLVTTNVAVEGPTFFSAVLPQPDTGKKNWRDLFTNTIRYEDYYRDIAVLAFPEPTNGVVAPDAVRNLTAKLDAHGKLQWEVPSGHWIIERMGHTTTGSSTRPPVKGGNGLECDKLSREAMDVHFANMIGKLATSVGSLAGSTFTATHIDSWEVGTQNWTPQFPQEFQKRRGYDPLAFLPDVTDGKMSGADAHSIIGGPEMARRFRWDFDQTISELLAENYVGRLAQLAHQRGLRLTLEGYNLPFGDEATYTQRADEPMTEFWATGGAENRAKGRQMASVAHIMGEKIVGAEAFTSGDSEQWKMHPATVKALGDYEFAQGINRFVVHRYAHQPYLDRFPGATMGPWGLHYERTQTWWEMSGAWHEYLARCQYMLRQGLFVADLCFLRPELPNQTYFKPAPAVPAGYKYDECSAEALIARMSVQEGRLVLPDGMSYGLLVLPEKATLMTPALVKKISQLVQAGATVLGPRPTASPSLAHFPKCDQEVAQLAAELWGNCDGRIVTEHNFGKGRVIWGQPLEEVLHKLKTPPDFTASARLNWIHRQVGDSEVYFVASEAPSAVEAQCHFRMKDLRPERWNPENGEISPLALYEETAEGISVPLRFEPSGSCFVVFRPPQKRFDPVVSFTRDGQPAVPLPRAAAIQIQKATYGVPGDAARTRDRRAKVQGMVNQGEIKFQVADMAEDDDPAYGVVKTLDLQYTTDGQPFTLRGRDPETFSLVAVPLPRATVIQIQKAAYGVPGDTIRTRDVRAKVQAKVNRGEIKFQVSEMAEGDDPALGVVKTLQLEYTANGQPFTFSGQDPDTVSLMAASPTASPAVEVRCDSAGRLEIVASQPGHYELKSAGGKTQQVEIASVPAPLEITGAWDVSFPSKWGAPDKITLDHLISLSDSTNAGVKYFSGMATYTKTFDWKPSAENGSAKTENWLDLGEVQVMAQIKLNGQDLGILWKPPFRVNVSGALHSGRNTLEIRVADLWPNRMIGDAALPAAERFTWSSYEPFTKDSPLPKSGLLGPVKLMAAEKVILEGN
jgi:hypothetical protein